jgi:hypothetical protein
MTLTIPDAALDYARHGWPVFPCEPRGKRPLVAKGFKAATTDEMQIVRWWQRWPEANIGIPAGPHFVVVDVDVHKGGQQSMQALVARHGPIPRTLCARTGGGGFHHLFAPRPEIICKSNCLGTGIDTRGNGGYIVVAPSIHATGAAYEWESDPFDTALAPCPDWLVPRGNLQDLPPPTNAPVDDRVERARAYVAAMPPAISGCGGHAATYNVARVLVNDFDLTPADAQALIEEYNLRCDPPWSARELAHKLKEAASKPHTRAKGCMIEPPAEVYVPPEDAPREPEDAPASTFPAQLLNPPGAVGLLCRWINETAIKPQPVFALANALAFWGAVVGRRVATPTDLRTNIYALGVGPAGCGKDHSRKRIKALADAAGVLDSLIREHHASDSAIYTTLEECPSVLMQLDEIGHWLTAATARNAPQHVRNMPIVLTEIFSSANCKLQGKVYALKEAKRAAIDQPNLCLYGVTVPATLFDGMTAEQVSDGFLARLIVFRSSDDDPHEREPEPVDPPAELLAMVKRWHDDDRPRRHAGNLVWKPTTVHVDADARDVFKAFDQDIRAGKAEWRGNMGLDTLWSRAREHAHKVALTLATGISFEAPRITGGLAEWACTLIDFLTRDLIHCIRQNVASTSFGRDILKILRVIRDAGGECSATALNRRTQGMMPEVRGKALTELLQTGQISKNTADTGKPGRPPVSYRIIAFNARTTKTGEDES